MDCRLFRYCEEDHSRFAVVSLSKQRDILKNALILIPGLADGILSMRYTERLSEDLEKIGYSMVQVNLSSSFKQFGFCSIQSDCKELNMLIAKIKKLFQFDKICLLGHSTGAQDVLFYMRHGEMAHSISGVILQGAVSDRDDLETDPQSPAMLEEAQAAKSQGKQQTFLSGTLYDAPVMAERFLSLASRLTDDDAFSVDLTEGELQQIFSGVQVPTLLCYSSEDEYVHDKAAQRKLAERTVKVLQERARVECKYFPGDHGLSKPHFYEPFVKSVCDFVSTL